MSLEAKKKHVIAIMESKRIWRGSYTPPLLHFARKAGLEISPLPFASFWQITLLMGGWFGPVWGICMWFFTWKDTGVQPGTALVSSVVASICFGVLMAAYHWWRKVADNLPDRDSFG